ncbi:helix-turn-helix transcriptional regulator [Shewanella colwelliana]|uniref:helix-turn-helix transcriptional regulator n=1 Tax=Shewanella colwelliana TaxID=23 RepID=UPI0004B646A1|nr:helix-turn-helix transcriptional regulator [Shewanella colwelliana]
MRETIPNVHFRETQLPEVGFEIIPLSSLYSKATMGSLNQLYQPHRVTFHNLIIFTSGNGEHFVDFNTIPVEKNSVVLVNTGQIQAFDEVNKPQGKLIIFTDEYLAKVASTIDTKIFAPTHLVSSYRQSFKLTINQSNALINLSQLISTEYESSPNIGYLQVLFAALLTKISETRPDIYHHHMSPSHIKCFDRFMLDLTQHYTLTRDANEFARRIGTSYKTLNKICKMATNRSAKQLIDAFIILEAKRRLSIDNQQVQQLADYLGFDEATNFIKYFKKHTLMTPNQFKKTLSVRHLPFQRSL